jgi:hypothetical protein
MRTASGDLFSRWPTGETALALADYQQEQGQPVICTGSAPASASASASGGVCRVGLAVIGRRFSGLLLDWAGVLTTNMVEVFGSFEAREGLPGGLFLSKWADPRGQDLYCRLELGEITQEDWNEGFGALLGISPDNLMERVLYDMFPAYDVMRVAREARAAGVRVAVLSNSLGREPFDLTPRTTCAGTSTPWSCRPSTVSASPTRRSSSWPWTASGCRLGSACSLTTRRGTAFCLPDGHGGDPCS